MPSVIINCDDFANDEEGNQLITRSFQQGIISSTTALVNYPVGLKDAVNLVKFKQIPKGGLGIHLNLTSGVPLLEDTKHCDLICEYGQFHGRIRDKPQFYITKTHKELIYNELKAQLNQFVTQFGFKPSHIDGHHHIHTEWAISRYILSIAKKNGLSKIRISRNLGENNSFSKKSYRTFFNWNLKQLGFITTDFFGDFSDLENTRGYIKFKTMEIMVHANRSINNNTINDYDNEPLHTKVESYLKSDAIDLINYSQL